MNDLIDSQAKTICTTCPYCGVGCGVLAHIDKTGTVSVAGDPNHPANWGKLCSKGSALAQTIGTERRIAEPYYQNKLKSMQRQQPLPLELMARADVTSASIAKPMIAITDWDTVLDDIAERLNETIKNHGRNSIMFYVSGQLLTEDYYVANKFIKGFIGNNNIDSNSRLCMSSAVAGHVRAFGEDLVPGNYEDFEHCDLLVMVGSNMAWCYPILFGRFLTAKKANPHKKLIVIDPRRTDSCEFADLHLPIATGTDTHLYNGLLHYLAQQGCQDDAYIEQSQGINKALDAAKTWTIDKVAQICQVPADSIRKFYECVAEHDKTVTAFSMGVNQSTSGTDKVNAIINTHILTGRVGKIGASPFSLTGQPNAMGGREVGALANLLAAHLSLENPDHRQLVADFWESPQPIAAEVGIKACDAADAILDGRVKAIWIMATNPVVSLPEADRFRQALAECDLVIVSDCSTDSDTVRCADIVLPAQGWGEKSGTVTNSERRISRQRALTAPHGLAKPDWWILSQVAKRMGMTGFKYQDAYQIFNEHMALTTYRNDPSQAVFDSNQFRYLNLAADISAWHHHSDQISQKSVERLTLLSLNKETYDTMLPFQWGGARIPMIAASDDEQDSIGSQSCNKAQMIAITPPDDASSPNFYPNRQIECQTLSIPSIDLRLITGRLRDQWHTMTRTGLAPQLNQHQAVPTLTVHPDDAEELGVSTDDFVQIHPRYQEMKTISSGTIETSDQRQISKDATNTVMVQVMISDRMRVGDAFMPIHWSNASASFSRVATLIPTAVDPHSSQPELKNSAISITRVPMQAFGSILVHPAWKDTVMVQLRTLLADYDTTKMQDSLSSTETSMEIDKSAITQLPALTWNLSHQTNSLLINIASPVQKVCQTLSLPEFWQRAMETMQATSESSASLGTPQIAFTSSQHPNQLRLIVTESYRHIVAGNSTATPETYDNQRTGERLIMAVYVAPLLEQLPSIHWLDSCFVDTSQIPDSQRYKWLLAGQPASGYVDPGPLVCSCMSVGENTIIEAITKEGCHTAATVGKQCYAGTNCGSCVGQINTLITEYTS